MLGAGADVRLGDAVVAAEHDRDRTRLEHLGDGALDRGVAGGGVGGQDRRVAEVDHAERREAVDPGLEVGARRAAGGADRARPEAGAGTVGDEVVGGRADDRHVGAGELRRVLGVGHARERQQPGEVGLLAELAPALERVDHVLQCYARRPGAGAAPGRAPAFLSRMRFPTRAALAALLAALVLCLLGAPTAGAGALQPRGEKIFFGISDTGDSADFGAFSKLLDKHPALIESFRTWGSDFPESIERWQDGAGAAGPPHHHRRQQRRP